MLSGVKRRWGEIRNENEKYGPEKQKSIFITFALDYVMFLRTLCVLIYAYWSYSVVPFLSASETILQAIPVAVFVLQLLTPLLLKSSTLSILYVVVLPSFYYLDL